MIGPGTTIRGSITGDEDLLIEGNVEGAVRLTKDLTIGKGSTVEATVEAQDLRVSGRLTGDATVEVALKVDAGASVVGDVKTPRVHIVDGAHFQGRIDMDFDVPAVD